MPREARAAVFLRRRTCSPALARHGQRATMLGQQDVYQAEIDAAAELGPSALQPFFASSSNADQPLSTRGNLGLREYRALEGFVFA